MDDISGRGHEEHEEDHLQDTLVTSFVIGVLILAFWLWIFLVYLDRV